MTASSMTEFTRASVADRTRISVRGLDPDRWIRKPELLSRSQWRFTELVNLLLKDEIVFLTGSLFGPVVQPGMQCRARNGRRPHTAKVVGSNPSRPTRDR